MNELKFLDALNDLNQLNVVNREYNLESGFFWVEFEDGRSLQLCLCAEYDTGGYFIQYNPQVDINNNGYYDGLSRDNNSWAADDEGNTEHIEEFLINQAQQAGLEIIV